MEIEPWLELERRGQESHAARREYETRVQSGEWPPQETLVPLLPYQREGMLHLAFKERALLADEMGLGKTIQAIAACALLHRLGRAKRVLVVAPASLKAEWEEQIQRFTPLSSLLVYGHHLARKEIYRKIAAGQNQPFFILTNYEQAIPDLDELNNVLGPLFRFNREFHLLDDRGRSIGVQNLDVLHQRVKGILLRRRKADVANEQDSNCRAFLSTDAGATGLNLQAASIVVNCDLPWNPARLEQRIARAWRKFQTQPVTVINLISEGTIEQRMLETLATKRSIAESVLDRPGEVTTVILRKSTKDAAERLRQLTGQSPTTGSGATPTEPTTPKPRDVTQEFAARLRQRLGAQLVACEERAPVGGGPVQILVVAEHPAQTRAAWMDSLRDEFFPSLEGNPPSHQIEILDQATFEAIERLVKAGLLQRTDTARRDLLDPNTPPPGPPPLTAEEETRLRETTSRAERARKRKGLGRRNAILPLDLKWLGMVCPHFHRAILAPSRRLGDVFTLILLTTNKRQSLISLCRDQLNNQP